MFNLKNLKFGTKILLLGIGSVLITILALVATVIWQSSQFNALAQAQFGQLTDADLSHITEGVYNMVKAQDEAVQQQVNSILHVAETVIHNAGQVRQSEEKIEWSATNEATQQALKIQLPKLYVGNTWLGQVTGQYDTTPIVDDVQLIAGGTATIFQRMNEQGDMLRVATNVLLPTRKRAIGTFTPALKSDGSPDPVIAAILRGSVYRGSTFVVDAWYDTAYEPLRDATGQVIGMVFVGIKQQSVESIRSAILGTQIGQTGYVYVLGSDGADQGRYLISQKGQRDGESIWNAQDAEGNYVVQPIVETALKLKFGETASVRYQWQNLGDPTPSWKIASVTYYEPWHWIIVATKDESEIQANRLILENGQTRMIAVAGAAGIALALVAGFLSVLLARSIARPVTNLVDIATQVTAGNLGVAATVESKDEIGMLALAFNSMTAQLRGLIGTLEQRVSARTAQLKASFDVGRAATSILDADQLLREVVNLITDRFNFYYAAVFTVDDTSHYAVLREATGEAGRTLKQVGHKLEVGGQSMVGAAIKTRTLRIALDVGHEAVRFANPLLPYTRSEISLPLLVGDRVLGALDVQSQQAAAFDDASAETLQSMADQIAIALLNAESFVRSEHQTRTLELLNRLSRDLASATSLEAISLATVRTVIELIGPSRLFVGLRSTNPNQLAVQEFLPDPEQPLGAVQLVPRADTIIGQTVQTKRTFPVPDMERLADQYQDVAMYFSLGIASGVAIPMQVREQVLGTFNVGLAQKNALEADQISQLEQVAAQLAIAIENRELLQQMQSTLTELDMVNRRLIGQAWEQYTHAAASLSGEWREGQWRQIPESHANALPANGLRIPIQVRGESIGEFNLTPTGTQSEWTPDDITFAQSLIDQVGQMIENARLFEESERLALRERTINDINSRVRQTIKMDTILETAVNELARSLKATRVFARIGSHDHDLAVDANGEGDEHA